MKFWLSLIITQYCHLLNVKFSDKKCSFYVKIEIINRTTFQFWYKIVSEYLSAVLEVRFTEVVYGRKGIITSMSLLRSYIAVLYMEKNSCTPRCTEQRQRPVKRCKNANTIWYWWVLVLVLVSASPYKEALFGETVDIP